MVWKTKDITRLFYFQKFPPKASSNKGKGEPIGGGVTY